MKRFVLALLLGLSSAAFAQNLLFGIQHVSDSAERPWFDGIQARHTVFGAATVNTRTGFDPYLFSFQGGYQYTGGRFCALGALHIAREDIQLTGEGIWWPVKFGLVRVGAGLCANLHFLSTVMFELNLMPGVYVEFRPFRWFMLSAHTNYFFKGRTIYSVARAVPMLVNHTASTGFRLQFFPYGGFSLWLGVDSVELFRYMVFLCPSFTAGVSYEAGRLTFVLEAASRYIDFLTLSATWEATEIRALVGVRL